MRSQQDRNSDLGHQLTSEARETRARRSGTTLSARSGEIGEFSPMERQGPLPIVPCVISRVPGTVYVSTRAIQREEPIAVSEPDAPRPRRR